MQPKKYKFSEKSGMLMPDSNTHFLEKSAHISLKVVTKSSFRDNPKSKIWHCYYSKSKNWGMQPKNLSFSDKFGIIPCSSTFFLEVDARISLKKTKSYFRGKQNPKM